MSLHYPRMGSSLCSEPYDPLFLHLISAQQNNFLFRTLGSRCGHLEPPLENTIPQSVFLLILFKMLPWVFPTFLPHPGSATSSSTSVCSLGSSGKPALAHPILLCQVLETRTNTLHLTKQTWYSFSFLLCDIAVRYYCFLGLYVLI